MNIKTYSDIINSAIGSVYRTGIANKILQHMDRIRNVSDDGQARRWVMELLQNSADTAYAGKNVDVEITLYEDRLLFKHNGRPFRVKDILSIINQVSSKSIDEKTVGRFGTGFMATFRLSEEVTISSILSDKGEDETGNEIALPYRSFEVTLDRHGRTKEEVIASIGQSMEQLAYVDRNELKEEMDPGALNTCFTYKLENEDSKQCAKVGMEDLKNTVRYILLFAENIGSVRIIDKVSDTDVTFRRGSTEKADEKLGILEIIETGTSGKCVHHMAYMTDGEVTLAAPCRFKSECEKGHQHSSYGFLPISELSPRVYTVFPLVGSEKFPFPVVVNSLSFRPNEPRNGITLVDNAQSVDAMVNKELMKHAVNMYADMLDSAVSAGFTDFENMVAIPEWHEDKEMSAQWVQANIYKTLYLAICQRKIIDAREREAEGDLYTRRMSLSESDMYIVDAENDEEKQAVKELVSGFDHFNFPNGEESWNNALRHYPIPEEKVLTAEKLYLDTQGYIQRFFRGTVTELVTWCSKLCALSRNNEMLRDLIVTSKAAAFPDQSGVNNAECLRRYDEIYTDNGIPEVLKNVSEILDRLTASNYDEKLEIRRSLLHKDFVTDGVALPAAYEISKIVKYISDRSDRHFQVKDFHWNEREYLKAWREAWKLMMSCMKDRSLYDACKVFMKDEDLLPYAALDERWYVNESMWSNSIKGVCDLVCANIEKSGDIRGLLDVLGSSCEDEVYGKLGSFMRAAYDKNIRIRDWNYKVFPDLHGKFQDISDSCNRTFYYDAVDHTELYSIAQPFGELREFCDFRNITIDRRIPFEYTGLHRLTDGKVCESINNALLRVFSRGPLSEATPEQQESCTKLLSLIRSDPKFTEENFPNYASEEDQMKLLTPQSAVIMQRKADKVDSLLAKLHINNVDELEGLIDNFESFGGKGTDSFYDNEYDVFADGLNGLTDDERTELCRKIGRAGENYVYEYLINEAQSKGYKIVSRNDDITELRQDDAENGIAYFSVIRGDHAGYKQSGWDFKVVSKSNGDEQTKYYEVKTHSVTGVLENIIGLSNSQMQMAMKRRDSYIVVKVRCDRRSFNCSLDGMYPDIAERIAEGKLTNTERYSFSVR